MEVCGATRRASVSLGGGLSSKWARRLSRCGAASRAARLSSPKGIQGSRSAGAGCRSDSVDQLPVLTLLILPLIENNRRPFAVEGESQTGALMDDGVGSRSRILSHNPLLLVTVFRQGAEYLRLRFCSLAVGLQDSRLRAVPANGEDLVHVAGFDPPLLKRAAIQLQRFQWIRFLGHGLGDNVQSQSIRRDDVISPRWCTHGRGMYEVVRHSQCGLSRWRKLSGQQVLASRVPR